MIFVSSWDDGHPLDRRVADLHGKFGLTATFYVPLRNRENRLVLLPSDLRALAGAGFEIGSHTAEHRYLNELTQEQAFEQISSGKQGLEQLLGQEIGGFCLPGGRYPRFVRAILARVGITHARTTENLRTDITLDRYAVPTTLQFYPHRWQILARNAMRHPHRLPRKLELLASAIRHGTQLTILPRAIEASAATAEVFHLWGHSWEIERLQAWRELEDALAAAAACCQRSLTVGALLNHDSTVRTSPWRSR